MTQITSHYSILSWVKSSKTETTIVKFMKYIEKMTAMHSHSILNICYIIEWLKWPRKIRSFLASSQALNVVELNKKTTVKFNKYLLSTAKGVYTQKCVWFWGILSAPGPSLPIIAHSIFLLWTYFPANFCSISKPTLVGKYLHTKKRRLNSSFNGTHVFLIRRFRKCQGTDVTSQHFKFWRVFTLEK